MFYNPKLKLNIGNRLCGLALIFDSYSTIDAVD